MTLQRVEPGRKRNAPRYRCSRQLYPANHRPASTCTPLLENEKNDECPQFMMEKMVIMVKATNVGMNTAYGATVKTRRFTRHRTSARSGFETHISASTPSVGVDIAAIKHEVTAGLSTFPATL